MQIYSKINLYICFSVKFSPQYSGPQFCVDGCANSAKFYGILITKLTIHWKSL